MTWQLHNSPHNYTLKTSSPCREICPVPLIPLEKITVEQLGLRNESSLTRCHILVFTFFSARLDNHHDNEISSSSPSFTHASPSSSISQTDHMYKISTIFCKHFRSMIIENEALTTRDYKSRVSIQGWNSPSKNVHEVLQSSPRISLIPRS